MKKLISLVLVLLLVLSVLPMTAFAAEEKKHEHSYHFTINRDGSFMRCSCGARKNFRKHVDPADAVSGKCVCGHTFMDNADLSLLYLEGMTLSPKFDMDKTEYEGKLVTWKDVTETKINARSFDAKATVELPEDLTIKEGTNVFEIKVTSEDTKVTKIYKVTVVK